MESAELDLNGKTIFVKGDVTFSTVMQILAKGEKYIVAQPSIVVDFASVGGVDSSAIALITSWVRKAKASDTNIKIVNLPSNLVVLAKTCGIHDIIPIN